MIIAAKDTTAINQLWNDNVKFLEIKLKKQNLLQSSHILIEHIKNLVAFIMEYVPVVWNKPFQWGYKPMSLINNLHRYDAKSFHESIAINQGIAAKLLVGHFILT